MFGYYNYTKILTSQHIIRNDTYSMLSCLIGLYHLIHNTLKKSETESLQELNSILINLVCLGLTYYIS